MRIAISNIAWDPPEDEAVAALLNARGIDAIDVAPSKYFPEPAKAGDGEVAGVKNWWKARGIGITGMQALLFGTSGLNVFGSDESRAQILAHLDAVCRIGAGLGASRLVFGSPKNRDRGSLTDEQVEAVALPFFRRLGDVAQGHGVVVCLEPNPPKYGANFMINSAETARVVAGVSHPAIRMQLDTGALTMNGEEPRQVVRDYAALIGHVHASEPDLATLGTLGDEGTDHAAVGTELRLRLPGHVVSIEMLASKNEPHVAAIGKALDIAVRNYGGESE